MLLLGVLAAQAEAAAPAAAGSYDLLETEILTGSQASVTFSSLNSTYGADYQHLQIRMTGATDRSGDWLDWLYLQFNSDTGSNYATHRLFAEGGTGVTSSAFTSQTSIVRAFYVKGASGDADSFGAGVMDILDPFETTKYTTTRALMGYVDTGTNEQIIALISGLWQNTNAIDSIKLESLNSANLISGTRISLYGLRSA